MSAIAGFYARRGNVVDVGALARVGDRLQHIGPDGSFFAQLANVAMIHRPFHTHGPRIGQPLRTTHGELLTFDGRLDNAGELERILGLDRPSGRDVDIVLAVYRRWGIDGFKKVVGDFALALWDAEKGLVLCTDAMGRRPLYYRATPEAVVWASQCRPLLQGLGLRGELNEEFIADYLANRTPSGSPFQGVDFLPGGHVLIASETTTRVRRYWSFDSGHTVRYGKDEEYEAHLRDLFRQVIAARLRADGPVVCELSGGLDSSTITAVADRLVKDGLAEAPEIRTFSAVYGRSASSDERRYIELVEGHIGRAGLHLDESDAPLLQPIPPSATPDVPTGGLCFQSRENLTVRWMRRLGARVVLSGMGGDQMFWSQPYPALELGDLARQGRAVELYHALRKWSLHLGIPIPVTAWLGAVEPLLPRRLRALTQRRLPLGEWLDPGFVKRTRMRERILPMRDDVGFRLPSTYRQYGLIRRTMRPWALDRYASEGYFEVRYPYLDRRLVEFALAIPLEQKVRVGESRSIVRRAFRGVVPDAILQRRTKSGPAEAFYRAVAREWRWLSELVEEPRVAEYGFADGKAFRTALRRACHGMATNQSRLKATLSLELWLRTLDHRPREEDTVPSGRRRTPIGGPHGDHAQAVHSA